MRGNNELLEKYLIWLEEANMSMNTIMTYKGHVQCFLKGYVF